MVNVPPSTNTKPGPVACFLNLEAYWNPPFLSLIFHPVALEPPFDSDFLLQLVKPTIITKDSNNFTAVILFTFIFIVGINFEAQYKYLPLNCNNFF